MRHPFALVAVASCLLVAPLTAQRPHERSNLWFTIGAGCGSFGCEDDCGDRVGGPSSTIGIGGTLGQNVLLGVMLDGWTKEEQGARLSAGTVTAAVRLYPSSGSGFHLQGGVGLAVADAAFGGFSETESGPGAVLGLGWDIRVGRMISLTPYLRGVGLRIEDTNFNFGHVGLAVTLH